MGERDWRVQSAYNVFAAWAPFYFKLNIRRHLLFIWDILDIIYYIVKLSLFFPHLKFALSDYEFAG